MDWATYWTGRVICTADGVVFVELSRGSLWVTWLGNGVLLKERSFCGKLTLSWWGWIVGKEWVRE